MAKKTTKQKQEAANHPTDAAGIRLRQPDRTGPKGKTLLELAGDRSLFDQADDRQRQLNRERGLPEDTGIVKTKKKKKKRTAAESESGSDEDEDEDEDDDDADDEDEDEPAISPRAERILDTVLWCVSLSMLHFTLDVLVQNQYAVSLEWPVVVRRALLACVVFMPLFHNLHRHRSDPRLLVFRFAPAAQDRLRQVLFFAASTLAGCYLIHITNNYGYLAVMEQAPPIGCLWVWAVIELDLAWAVSSLAIAAGFTKLMGYGL